MSNKPRFTQEIVEKKETGESSGLGSRMLSKFRNTSRTTRMAIFGVVAAGGVATAVRLLPEEEEEIAPIPMVSVNMEVLHRQRAEKKAKEAAVKNQESAEVTDVIEEKVVKAPEPPLEEAAPVPTEEDIQLTFAQKVEWRIAFLQAEIIRLETNLSDVPMDSSVNDHCILRDYRNELRLWWNGETPQAEVELDELRASFEAY